ncbi:hypothetical protein Y032_0020g116 [Ancylostoma ceylanicum]|uniref:Uncharacterized protein n=1 Tax=Ancylostoma ceylanicum TaxID=53326 RepID=A0A016V2B3_9BILA|nr:hypothetical protein Y032_0020g116 [Ancylostoma ceylanicum]
MHHRDYPGKRVDNPQIDPSPLTRTSTLSPWLISMMHPKTLRIIEITQGKRTNAPRIYSLLVQASTRLPRVI